jgi:hypothetical protein
MGGWYFPKKENLVPVNDSVKEAIWKAIVLLNGEAPHSFWGDTSDVFGRIDFYCDHGMSVESGVLGATSFLNSDRVLLSPLIVQGITWETTTGIPNNETAMNTVIHELTHLHQMRKWFGLFYLFLNAPWFSFFTLEKWANENGVFAQDRLTKLYNDMRKKLED